jgi:ABC-type branched-subunit amino acid transport system ATPase component
MSPVLEAQDIHVYFGGVSAVNGVTIDLEEGEMLGLVGPNGSGKTTLLNALCGVVDATGYLAVDGAAIRLGRPRASWRAGITRVFQAPQTFDDLSCLENVLVSSPDQSARGITAAWITRPVMWRRERARWASAMAALEQVGLADVALAPAGLLTYGQRRLLELARALAASPRVLLLDEPSAGLNDAEMASLGSLLARVHEGGLSLVLIDHKVDFVDSLCSRIVVLELGSVIAEGEPHTIWQDERVMRAYLGVGRDARR